MNCRIFEMQVADWLSGRLSGSAADQMEQHRAACASCSQIANNEARMARLWTDLRSSRTSSESDRLANDLWAKVEARLESKSVARRSSLAAWLSSHASLPRFGGFNVRMQSLATAACAVAVLVPVAVCMDIYTRSNSHPIPTPAAHPIIVSSTVSNRGASPVGSGIVTLVDDTRGDSSIDDPIGGAMEHVWTHVSTSSKNTENY